MAQDPKIRNFQQIEGWIRGGSPLAQNYVAKWQEFVTRTAKQYPDIVLIETSEDWSAWLVDHPDLNITDRDVFVGKEIELAYGFLRETHEEDQMEKEGSIDLNNVPGNLLLIPGLALLFRDQIKLMEDDPFYQKIAEQKETEWLEKNKREDFNSKEGLDYLYGSLDDEDAPSLQKETEEEFRADKKLRKRAEKYDRENKKVYKKSSQDPALARHELMIEEHARARFELTKQADESVKYEDVYKRVSGWSFEKFVRDHPEKATAYSQSHEEIQTAFERVTIQKGFPGYEGTARKQTAFYQRQKRLEKEEEREDQQPQVSQRDIERVLKEFERLPTQTVPSAEPVEPSQPPEPPQQPQPPEKPPITAPPRPELPRQAAQAARAAANAARQAAAAGARAAVGALAGIGWPVFIVIGVVLLLTIFIVLFAGEGEETDATFGRTGPACPNTTTNRGPASCRYLNPAIDLYDTSIPQRAIEDYISRYSPTFVNAGIGSVGEFRNRVTYIVNNSKIAGLNPAIFLGYWKSESGFSTVGTRHMGCVGDDFYEQVDCALAIKAFSDPRKNPVANCAKQDNPERQIACDALKEIRAKEKLDEKHPINYPIDSFDEFAEGYGPYEHRTDGEPRNCTHTYNVLIDIATELGKCIAPSASGCPVPDGKISTPSFLGENGAIVGHCGQQYRAAGYFCEQNSRRAKSIDVPTQGKDVILPTILGQALDWTYIINFPISPADCERKAADGGCGLGLVFQADLGEGRNWTIHFVHMDRLSLPEGTRISSGNPVGKSPIGHVHINVGQNVPGDPKFVPAGSGDLRTEWRWPDRDLQMCL